MFYEEADIGIADVRKVIEVVKDSYGDDFGKYALISFKRRILLAMKKFEYSSAEQFANKIASDPHLYDKFVEICSVETTEFYRDPALWRYFKDTLLPLLNKNFSPINVWMCECATGEELFSLAILLKKAGQQGNINLTATVWRNTLISRLKTCRFPISKLELSENNYKRVFEEDDFSNYFRKDDNYLYFDQDLIKDVNILAYDLSKESHLKKMNVIFCRNNMIYYNSNYQDAVLSQFHKSLSLGGFLIIGHKENIDWCQDAKKFQIENKSEKVYRKTGV